MSTARGLMSGARTITHGKQLRGQCDGTTSNRNRMATHVGPNALLRTSTYPNVSAGPTSGPLFLPALSGENWHIDGSTEMESGGLCTFWPDGTGTVYTYSNSPASTGGTVPSGGLYIDGFFVPAGTYVFQFMDLSAGPVEIYSPAPGIVFRGCRARNAWTDPNPVNTNAGPPAYGGGLWFLYCDLGGNSGLSDGAAERGAHITSASALTAYRCYFSYAATLYQPEVTDATVNDFIENYCENLTYLSSSPHLDGYIIEGGEANCRILRNYSVHAAADEQGNTINQTVVFGLWNGLGSDDTAPLAGTGLNPDGTPGYQIRNNYAGGTGDCFYLGNVYEGAAVANIVLEGNLVTTSIYPVTSSSGAPGLGGGYDGPLAYNPPWGASGCTQAGNLWADGTYSGKSLAGTTFTSPAQAATTQYTVNYFPITNGGYSMWPSYNGTQYAADIATAKALGFNTMRVFLAALTGVFGFPSPTSPELANWANFYGLAKARGMNLHVTLFDQFGAYGYIDNCQTWVTAILGALPDTDNIAVIELQNEVQFSSTATYEGTYGAGWTLGESGNTIGYVTLAWAELMIPYIRSAAPGIPVTASATNAPSTDLAAFYGAANGQTWAPDWWDWHCYAGSPQLAYTAICGALAQVGNNPALLAIGECGLTSAATGTQGTLQGQQEQADYIQAVRWACAQQGMPGPSPWILFDIEDCAQFESGQTYGLYTTSGTPKLAAAMYQAIPPGAPVPPVGINGAMSGSQPDTNGNTLPARWLLYLGTSGSQPVSAVIDDSTTYEGMPSVKLSGSSGTSPSGNPPALQSGVVPSPVYPGFTYTFSVALMASGNYNGSGLSGNPNVNPCLEISWYDSSGDYISSASGGQLTLTGSFALHSLESTAPAGAAIAVAFVNVGFNAGGIWAAAANWVLG